MTVESREDVAASQPCMIVAHGDPSYTAGLARAFRRQGWDVYQARSGPETRRLARMLEPELVVMATDLPEESGWLTCEKLTRESPGVKVFLVGVAGESRSQDYAAFVGAAGLFDSTDSVPALVQEVCGRSLPAAG
jgi:DNA-binding response OmpR family regulator